MNRPAHFVLLRGLWRETRHWGEFPSHLQQQFPGALISTPDIPGNGLRNHETSPDTIAGMTDALRQLTDTAGARTVADARLGLVAGFGMVTYDRCLCTGAVILGRPQ